MKLVEGIDYTWDGDKMVLTKEFLLKRGFCCNSKCRNCPYNASNENGLEIEKKLCN